VIITSTPDLAQLFPQLVFLFVPLHVRQEARVHVRIFAEPFPLQLGAVFAVDFFVVFACVGLDEGRAGLGSRLRLKIKSFSTQNPLRWFIFKPKIPIKDFFGAP
jgi:hypothetical protein